MQTDFTQKQLADPTLAQANKILRKCVHCGFCTATCPTYLILGDENDSPRGRIYLIKSMLETDAPASPRVAKHLDRCLSCLSCMTTCPSGVDYMHLIDAARVRVTETHTRPLGERLLRRILAITIPDARLFRLSLIGARLAKPFAGLLPGRLKTMVGLAPAHLAPASDTDRPQVFVAEGKKKGRVALLTGCAQKVLRPSINAATVRLLTRAGLEVVVAPNAGCCGALVHHMGEEGAARDFARRNIRAWTASLEDGGLDAVVINASGCGTTVKDYGHMLAGTPEAEAAKRIAALARDVTEVLGRIELPPVVRRTNKAVAYHSACSLQHGQKIRDLPKTLLKQAGFEVREPLEPHICCGSAGTYNMMQPELAEKLGARKVENLQATGADVVAGGNIGCLVQIDQHGSLPVVHTVELLDWATGGPVPPGLNWTDAKEG